MEIELNVGDIMRVAKCHIRTLESNFECYWWTYPDLFQVWCHRSSPLLFCHFCPMWWGLHHMICRTFWHQAKTLSPWQSSHSSHHLLPQRDVSILKSVYTDIYQFMPITITKLDIFKVKGFKGVIQHWTRFHKTIFLRAMWLLKFKKSVFKSVFARNLRQPIYWWYEVRYLCSTKDCNTPH